MAWHSEYEALKEQLADRGCGGLAKHGAIGRVLDDNALIWSEDRRPADVVLRRTSALLDSRKAAGGGPDLSDFEHRLHTLERRASTMGLGKRGAMQESEQYQLYLDACALRRELALSNPHLDFDEILFCTFNTFDYHFVGQYQAFEAVRGGGLYIVSGYKAGNFVVRNVLENSRVVNGRLKGVLLDSADGVFLGPDLSFDAKTIVFAWSQASRLNANGEQIPSGPTDTLAWTPHTAWHLFKVNVDGTELTQLTDGYESDYDPCWLPNGRIVFISERRGGVGRCNAGHVKMTGTLHSMKSDGTDIVCLSFHETNEFQPSVDNAGMIVYTRWDYVDRDFNAAHNFWICYPDGRDPRAPHGNYFYPLSTWCDPVDCSTISFADGRADRPWAEYGIRAIPGTESKYVMIAGTHHAESSGPLALLDISIEDDFKGAQVKMITGDCWPHEAGGATPCSIKRARYYNPWPLSEDYYIATEGIAAKLIDKFGNKEELFYYRDTAEGGRFLSLRYPIPLKPRVRADGSRFPAPATGTYQGERAGSPGHCRATIAVMNVYESDFAWPADTKIDALRIVQIIPKPRAHFSKDSPRVGYSEGGIARVALGTVPVESDGSTYFEAPIEKEIYFQALDERGMAVQSMRSGTYVHAGENLSCLGCHENRWHAPSPNRYPHRHATRAVKDCAGGGRFTALQLCAIGKTCP